MNFKQHNHGGNLRQASQEYNIPIADWLDLSTGISPFIYPLSDIPIECWQRLPEINDGLEAAAKKYYGSEYLLPVSGSQEAIQRLPILFAQTQKRLRVGIIKPAYHSHQQAWKKAGYEIITLKSSEVGQQISSLDILIVVNPTNPTAEVFTTETLLRWHQQLSQHNGTLIVDEAFVDATPEKSLICQTPKRGLIVLRSIGKFFGLAGVRLGFVWAEAEVLKQLAELQDDWSVSHPARWVGRLALQDTHWQKQQGALLKPLAQRLQQLLEDKFFTKPLMTGGVYFNTPRDHVVSTHLFAYFQHPRAARIHQQLAQQGVLVRLFNQPPALRLGLPANEGEWGKLEKVLESTLN